MKETEIVIPRKLTTQLLHWAQISPDAEICGLVSSKQGQAYRCYPVKNVAAEPGRRFQLEPTAQIAALKTLRDNGEELFAIYHSHPSAPAEPSALDLDMAAYPDALYLIISLNTKGILQMRGFYLNPPQAREVPLALCEA